MKVDHRLINPETLRAVAEEFVLREGTDYGDREVSLDAKVGQVMRLLEKGKIQLVFDAETETCDLREVVELGRAEKDKAPKGQA
jgi:uncharacterized protein YheU (UPF0270 family)